MDNIIKWAQELMSMDNTVLGYYIIIALKVVFIIVIGRVSISIFNRIISKFFKLYPRFKMDEKKSTTLSGILKSVVKYMVYTIVALSALNAMNIPTAPLLATAGLGGLAIGFGAQSLVKDVFTGFFILFEDQYGVGDYITIGSMTGTVEDMGLRITKLRAFTGDLHIIPNGEIKMVTNHSRGSSLAVIDVGVDYGTDIDRAIVVLRETAEDYYRKNPEKMTKIPEVLGIVKFNESEAVIRTIAETMSLKHWEVERGLRKHILEAFKANKIEVPYPRRVIVSKDEA